MDTEKDGPSSRHNNNANELPEMGLGMSGMSGEYDYATALTVTMTVGICLILLNVLVFAAIMCRRKRGLSLPPMSNHPSSGTDGRAGIPLKSPYHQVIFFSLCLSLSAPRSLAFSLSLDQLSSRA